MTEEIDMANIEYEAMSGDEDPGDPVYEGRSMPIDGDLFRKFGDFLDEVGLEAVANRPDGRFLLNELGEAARRVVQIRSQIGDE